MARLSLALGALVCSACSATGPAAAPVPSLYAQRIAPIFAERCSGCHGTEKQKGRLALHTPEAIEQGGLDGPVIVPGKPAESELLRRLRLPLADEDHMPPEDRPQPGVDEVAALESWIAAGASFDSPGAAAAPAPVAKRVAPADPKAIAALAQALVHVEKSDPASELLWIDFAANAPDWTDAELARQLAPLAPQVAELSLARTQAGAETLALAACMPNLERLDLRASSVDDGALARLGKHAQLAQLVLVRARLSDASVDSLLSLPALERVYLWQSGITPEGIARLSSERPKLCIDAGDAAATATLESEAAPKFTKDAPIPGAAAAAAASLEPVNTACPVSGAPVNKKFLVVFEGRVVGFCCNKCPAEFWADPEKFRAKLP
jgi:Planctomycete cytochrome C